MDRLIYTAVSGASRNLMQQQVHANNLANANTEGFRADLERASSTQVAGQGYDARYLVGDQQTSVDMTPGAIRETGNPLDVAIKGEGLLAVRQGGREV
ncbi:MAG: flagellar hook-basal body complex protein, partial [Enterobacteriaceae bacterium]